MAQSGEYKQRHGAVIYHRGHILSIGYNRKKTHPVAAKFYDFGYLHSELDAILKCDEEVIRGAMLACVRINRVGTLMYSRPCEGCRKAMVEYGIIAMVYSTKDGIEKEML